MSDVSTETSYSAALTEDLKAHRLVMGKHALMMQSALAVDVLHFTLCVKAFVLYSSTPADISLNQSHDEPKQGDFSENKALERVTAHKESLDLLWLEPESNQERFEAFQKLDEAEKQKQLAFATALTLKTSLAQKSQPYSFEFLYQLLDFDAADYWRPTTDSFLKRIGKDALIDIARPVMSEEWLKAAESLKKADLVKQMDIWFNGGDDALTDAQKAHFANWMPQGF